MRWPSPTFGTDWSVRAAATCRLESRFHEARRAAVEAECQDHDLRGKLDSLEEQRHSLEDHAQAVSRQVEADEKRLTEVQGVLDLVVDLEKRGFGGQELSRLYEILAGVAASQGAPPGEGVAQFFRTVDRYEQVISLDMETSSAEARVATARAEIERWEAEARSKEAKSQARIYTIDLTEELLAQGVMADDLPHWQRVLSEAGVAPEKLATHLEEYASQEALIQARREEAEQLQSEVSQLESQVKALGQERDSVHSAIEAVRDKALKQVRAAENQAKKQVDAMFRDATELGRARKETAALGEWIEAAQLLKSGDPESWERLPQEVIQHMVLVTLRWAEAWERDLQVPLPCQNPEGLPTPFLDQAKAFPGCY